MAKRYPNIKRAPSFIAAYSEMRSYLRRTSLLAFMALPAAIETILDVIDKTPRAWPNKRKSLDGAEREFHLAIIDIAYRRLHIRYIVDKDNVSFLVAVWVDGHDEPDYTTDVVI